MMNILTNFLLSILLLTAHNESMNTLQCSLKISGSPHDELQIDAVKYPNKKTSKIENEYSNGEYHLKGFKKGYYFLYLKNIKIKSTEDKLDGNVSVNGNGNCCMRVSLQRTDGSPIKESSTNENGEFHFENISPGTYKVMVTVHFTDPSKR